ncbi:MAG: SPFH domain-containing protein [Myxococcales bacterium]
MDWFVLGLEIAAAWLTIGFLAGVRYIPIDHIGIVEKRFSLQGSVASGVIALSGQAGFQPDVLRGGLHYRWILQYAVHRVSLVTIAQGRLGYLFARDGRPLLPGQTLARAMSLADVQDVPRFFEHGGQRGPQRTLLREGTYAINLAQFVVITEEKTYYLPQAGDNTKVFEQMASLIRERGGFRPVVVEGSADALGIVTVHDGNALCASEIIAPIVGNDPAYPEIYHDSFQDPERFLAAGGKRGRQLQVLVEGTYFVNRLFATVELVPKTTIEVGTVGVVVSYTGSRGTDVSGSDYKHGELVQVGERGVWADPLLPGKYAFNTYAGHVVSVPTTNFILKWNRSEVGAHRYDENLAEVSLITKDAFEPSLPLSVVVHIDYRKAPLVVQRFGDVKRLVEQTLDPMVSAYFKNIAQNRTLIQLLQDRSQIQEQAGAEMRAKFSHYNLELEEVLIGTPRSAAGSNDQIVSILDQLRNRQIAEEQVSTYALKERAAVKEREFREAEARAAQQRQITESELSIAIQTNQGKAETQRVMQQAAQLRTMAEAEADKIRMYAEAEAHKVQRLAHAEADRTARVGVAEAVAIEEQVRAYGGARLRVAEHVLGRFAQAIEHAGIEVVPRVMMQTGNAGVDGKAGGTANLLESLIALTLSDKLGDELSPPGPRSAGVEAMSRQVRDSLGG